MNSASNNLRETSTDMLVNYLGNTDKLVETDKRWNYADHKGEKDDDELDDNIDNYIQQKLQTPSVFKKEQPNSNANQGANPMSQPAPQSAQAGPKPDIKTNYDSASAAPTPSSPVGATVPDKPLSKEEIMLLKLDMLRKLGELKQCGVNLSQNYDMDSDLKTMQYEFKLHSDIRAKQNFVGWASHMMIGTVKGLELLNDNYNPFDIKLEGLSNKVGSEMGQYYQVIGDIYEKYNQPGKAMEPEWRLFLMLTGACIGMQAHKIGPSVIASMANGIGGMSNTVKTDEKMVNDLRKKAEADSFMNNEEIQKLQKKEHDGAAQKALDLKYVKEKELEYQKLSKMMDSKNGDARNFKKSLLLSSEAPSNKDKKSKPKRKEEDDEEEQQHELSYAQIEQIQRLKYMEEQKRLETLRQLAHNKTMMNTKGKTSAESKKNADLIKQTKQLDNIMNSLTKNDDDNESSMSTVSIHPNLDEIMKKTAEKYRQSDKQSDKPEKSKKKEAEQSKMKKNSNGEYIIDSKVKALLEEDDSELDHLSREDISIGSSDKDKKRNDNDFGEISVGSKTKGTKTILKSGNKH